MQRTIPLLLTIFRSGSPRCVGVALALAAAGPGGATAEQVAAATGVAANHVRAALRQLLESGAAEQVTMGRGEPWRLRSEDPDLGSSDELNIPNRDVEHPKSGCSNIPNRDPTSQIGMFNIPNRDVQHPKSGCSETGTDDAILARRCAGARVRENREDIEDRLGPGLERNFNETVKETLVDIHILTPLKKIIRWRTKEKDREDENIQEIHALFAKWGGKRCEVKAREYAQKHGKIPWAGEVRELLEAEDIANRPKLYDPWIKIAADLLARGDAENAEKARKLKESQA